MRKIVGPKLDFKKIFTFDLQTWFKVIANILPKGTIWMKYEPDWIDG